MVGQHPTQRSLDLGKLVIPLTVERTAAGARGETNAYISGATIILQMYDADAAAWRAVTLT